jgi:hypothetical protein
MYKVEPEAIREGDEVTYLDFIGEHRTFIAESTPQEGRLYIPPPIDGLSLGYKVVYLSQVKDARRSYRPGDWMDA